MARVLDGTPAQRVPSLWPREHGAYVTLLTPLVSALAFAPSLAGLAWAVVALLLFVAHEPLLLLQGRRGARKRELGAGLARRALLAIAIVSVPTVLALIVFGDESVRRALLASALLCAGAFVFAIGGREKSLPGELVITAALVGLTLPALALSSVAPAPALRFLSVWLVVHALAMLTARAYVYRKREGDGLLRAATLVAALAALGSSCAAWNERLSWSESSAVCLVALVTFALASGAFRPRSPKKLGWALAAAIVPAVVLIGLALR